ncbi:N-acetylmuramoyl-L-alanine amidase [Streptomyces sp. NPDC048659]|uniref:N-acetylmuramoyl-L-alanine amidase n=1 Tax=Streptomyces sp. NPDC048659 TaxID=3155489 RepID=UPI00342214F6
MRRRRIWGTAAAVVAGLTGVLVLQGATGDTGGGDGAGGGGPVRAETRSLGLTTSAGGRAATLGQRDTERFSMLGVTWTDPSARITGTVEARTRAAGTDRWGRWVRLDGDSGEGERDARRGGTEPAWVGDSDGVEVRVVAGGRASAALPAGLRLDMVDPGRSKASSLDPAAFAVEGAPAADETADPGSSPSGEPTPDGGTATATDPAVPTAPTGPTPDGSASPTDSASPSGPATDTASPSPSASSATASPTPSPTVTGPPSTAPRPPIRTRAQWGADESISPEAPGYLPDGKVRAVVVHHTAESNDYSCADGPRVVRGIYTYHVKVQGWKDVGYNFLVDKCGVVYEGRKGGADRPVQGAHAYGFNAETTGVSVLGTYVQSAPPTAAMVSVARVAAWKLGQYGVDPKGTATLTAGSAGANYFKKSWAAGARMTFPTILGHRDSYNTQCPGNAFYAQLGTIRNWAAGPVTGLTVKSVAGASHTNAGYVTRGPVTVGWSSTTPADLIARHELLLDGKVVATAPGSAVSAAAIVPAGTHTLQLRAVHQSKRTATAPALTVVGDTTAPRFSAAPTAELTTGTATASAAPVKLRWKAADAVALRDVRLTSPAVTYGPTATVSGVLGARPGTATPWTLTAYDLAGNKAAAGVSATPVILQETAAARSGTWAAKSSANYLGGASYSSGTKNASLSWTFTGRSAAWVVSRSAASGQAHVYVDGVKAATVDLKSATTRYRDVVWTRTWAGSGKHTVKIVVVGTAGRPTVTTDGLIHLK